jgi:hypothetical protein
VLNVAIPRRRLLWATLAALSGFVAIVAWPAQRGEAATWTPDPSQIQQASDRMMSIAAESAPAGLASAPGAAKAAWPAFVSSAKYIAVDRSTALVAMGTPNAAPGDQRPVFLFQLTGNFAVAPPFSPTNQRTMSGVKYLQAVIDAATGDVLDFGAAAAAMNLARYAHVSTAFVGSASS